jgi:hypothetical protein
MLVNIHFNNLNASKISELYLYQRLRWYAKDRAGSIKGFPFSKTDFYDILPKLIEKGWVLAGRVVKHRNLLSKYKCSNYASRISEYDLSSIDNFKAFVFSSCESFILFARKRKANKREAGKIYLNNWVKKRGQGNKSYSGNKIENNLNKDIANSVISKILNVSNSTVSRWRRLSHNLNYNTYTMKATVHNSLKSEASFILSPNSGGKSNLYFNDKVHVTISNGPAPKLGFKSKTYGGKVKFSIGVDSSIPIFINKRAPYNGLKRLQ